ncbi:hypothetical protein H4R20_000320, partial [Coemansia guatemalensis]
MPINEPETKSPEKREEIKQNVTKLFKGGVIAIVTTVNQAKVAEDYGARGVIVMNYKYSMAKKKDQTPRGADPSVVRSIMSAVHIPVIGRVRYGHIAEARIMQACGVAAIEESDVVGHGNVTSMEKKSFNVPVICFVVNLKEALLRISEGASMVVSRVGEKLAGEGGTSREDEPNVRHASNIYLKIQDEIEILTKKNRNELWARAQRWQLPLELLEEVAKLRRLPVPFFASGGVMLPMDVAMLMELGYDGVVA